MRLQVFILLVFIQLLSFQGMAQRTVMSNEVMLQSDNDAYLFCGNDRYYTNGLFITYNHLMPKWEKSKAIKKIAGLEIGQKMYNPHTGYITEIVNVDRPFAAYLFLGGHFKWYYTNETVLSVELQSGWIGEQAYGRQLQEFIHNSLHLYHVSGWQFQVNNETEVNSAARYMHLLTRSMSGKSDLSVQAYFNAGTTFLGSGAGFLWRLGKTNRLYSSAITNSRTGDQNSAAKEFFFYVQPMVHYAGYDGTMEGGIFLSNKGPITFKPKPVILSQEAGVHYAKGKWELAYSVIFKTREVKSAAKADEYAMVHIGYLF